jgi:hypothetical protein
MRSCSQSSGSAWTGVAACELLVYGWQAVVHCELSNTAYMPYVVVHPLGSVC